MTAMLMRYPHDPARARQLLDDAGYRAVNGVRFHVTMKTSTDASTRLLAAVLQQQLREVGIALDIRTFEFATFFCGCNQRRLPDSFAALGRRQQSRSRHLRARLRYPAASLPSAPIAPSTPTRASMN